MQGLHRVHEFKVLAQKAQELDIKAVYLFGGAAAALAHYVHRDLVHQHMQNLAPMRVSHQASQEQSAPAFDETEFNYTLWSMLFYNQDIDIVVDTKDVQKMQHLDTAITDVATSSFKWDFWSLHTAYNNRPALLTSQDFAHQHTDSHSTILIPIYLSGHQTAPGLSVKPPLPKNIRATTQSQPPQQQPQIYDLRSKLLSKGKFDATTATSSHATQFLTDVLEKKLSCYYSAKHRQSPRYKKGDNPEIFFAVRTLTKAFQYGLDIPDDCMSRIQQIFQNFNAKRDLKTSYSQYWIEKNAKKLYTHSIDLERSQRVLQQLGALEALKNIKGNTDEPGSMAWWLNRQPLLSQPLGKWPPAQQKVNIKTIAPTTSASQPRTQPAATSDDHLTAEQLGLRYVVHSTQSIEAYESIVNSYDKRPNAFISRSNTESEATAFGDGFYTSSVDNENICTNHHALFGICLRVHPQAQKNIDFQIKGEFKGGEQVVVFTNKSALTIANTALSQATDRFNTWLDKGGNIVEIIQHSNKNFKNLFAFLLNRHPAVIEKVAAELLKASLLTYGSYIGFWRKHLELLPASYVAQNYQKFLPPKWKQLIHNITANQIDDKTRGLFLNLLGHVKRVDDYAAKGDHNFIGQWKQKEFVDLLFKFFAALDLKEQMNFWTWHIDKLPSQYISQNFKKFLPSDYKNIIDRVPVNQQGTKLNWNKSYEDAYFVLQGFVLAQDEWRAHQDHLEHVTVPKLHWHEVLKRLLTKIKKLNLHKFSEVQIDPLFEALLGRVLLEAVSDSEQSVHLEPAELWMRMTIWHDATASLPPDLDLMFNKIIVNNIDYFIANNNMLILRFLTGYIFNHPTLKLDKKLRLLTKIIRHEANFKPEKFSKYRYGRRGYDSSYNPDDLYLSSDQVWYSTESLMIITHNLFQSSGFHHPLILMEFWGTSAMDVVSALYNQPISDDKYKQWARHKGSEQLFKSLYEASDEYIAWMADILMSPPWAQQPWALELVEKMFNTAITRIKTLRSVGYSDSDLYENKATLLPRRIWHTLLGSNTKRSAHEFVFKYTHEKRRYEFFFPNALYDLNSRYDYKFLESHPAVLRMLEKIILCNNYIHPTEAVTELIAMRPLYKQYFANKYFNGQEDFKWFELYYKIQQQHLKQEQEQEQEQEQRRDQARGQKSLQNDECTSLLAEAR